MVQFLSDGVKLDKETSLHNLFSHLKIGSFPQEAMKLDSKFSFMNEEIVMPIKTEFTEDIIGNGEVMSQIMEDFTVSTNKILEMPAIHSAYAWLERRRHEGRRKKCKHSSPFQIIVLYFSLCSNLFKLIKELYILIFDGLV